MHVTPPNVVLYLSPEYDTHSPKQVSPFLSVPWIFCDGVLVNLVCFEHPVIFYATQVYRSQNTESVLQTS